MLERDRTGRFAVRRREVQARGPVFRLFASQSETEGALGAKGADFSLPFTRAGGKLERIGKGCTFCTFCTFCMCGVKA